MVILGAFVFQGLEIPEHIGFGGKQTHVKHENLGGARVLDAMGPSDADLSWSGRFQGSLAWPRAKTLDAMRIAGQALPLIVDAEFRFVMISDFTYTYERFYQIPYSITCVVVNNPNLLTSLIPGLDVLTATDMAAVTSLIQAL